MITIARLTSAKRAAAMKKILLLDMRKSVPDEYESKLIHNGESKGFPTAIRKRVENQTKLRVSVSPWSVD